MSIQNVSKSQRSSIVYRIDGGKSVVQASRIQTPDDLAFAIRFLTDHFLYKRSKASGVTSENVAAVEAALAEAAESFSVQMGTTQGSLPVSTLPGTVSNPFDLIA